MPSYRVFWNLRLQMALEWLGQGCLVWRLAILLSFAAEDCKLYWSGCIHAAIVICQKIFAILAVTIFLPKILFTKSLQSASKSFFFCFGVEIQQIFAILWTVTCEVWTVKCDVWSAKSAV